MQVVRTEAHESYRADIVVDVVSDSVADMEANVERIVAFFDAEANGSTTA